LVSHCSKPELHTLIADYKPLCCRCSNLLIASAFQDIYIKCALPSSNYNKKSTTIAEVQNSSRSPAENKFSISKGMNTLGVTYKSRGRDPFSGNALRCKFTHFTIWISNLLPERACKLQACP
jgi:hypothetical protein